MVSKFIGGLIISEIEFRDKLSFPKEVDVRITHDSCSRIRVDEVSTKKNEIKYAEKLKKNVALREHVKCISKMIHKSLEKHAHIT